MHKIYHVPYTIIKIKEWMAKMAWKNNNYKDNENRSSRYSINENKPVSKYLTVM